MPPPSSRRYDVKTKTNALQSPTPPLVTLGNREKYVVPGVRAVTTALD
jgi:hypothetical protein